MFSLILSCITIVCALISIFFTIKTICLRNKTYEDISEIYKMLEKKAINNYNINAEARHEAVKEFLGCGCEAHQKEDTVKESKKKKKNEVKRNDSI